MKKKIAFITGIAGQDGSYLAELLLSKQYEVWGLVRRSSNLERPNINHLVTKIKLIYGDLADTNSLRNAIKEIWPDEIYNLAAQSHVKISFDIPEYTMDITGTGVIRLLEIIRTLKPDIKFYQASSSEMFGKVVEIPQTEKTPFYPRSPYGVAKVAAHQAVINYRESYGLYACSGILYNHESVRRSHNFVTRKITFGIAKIKAGLINKITLGNLDAKRDWGYAPDYVEAQYMMLQQNIPEDFVIATGNTYTIKQFLEIAFKYVNKDWRQYVLIDEKYKRPAEVDILQGDASKAREILSWKPKTNLTKMIQIMIDSDIEYVKGLKNEKK